MYAKSCLALLTICIALITGDNWAYFARGHFLHLAPMLLVCCVAWSMLRDSGPPRAATVFWSLAAAAAASVALELGFEIYKRKPFDENGLLTLLSVTQLLLTSFLTFRIWRLRRRPGGFLLKDKSRIWLIMALGFLYLAADEKALFHEGFDRTLHKVLAIHETGWTSRLDDILVGLYGLAGMAVLWFYLSEIRRFPLCARLLKAGFAALFLSVLADVSASRSDFFIWLLGEGWGTSVYVIVGELEEILKIFSEIFFLTAFSSALRQARGAAASLRA